MKACEIGIHTFCRNSTNVHVRLYTDNTTSCSYINNYGGKISNLDEIARRLWFWCIERHIHISAYHIAGVTNKQADKLSRSGNDDLEWALDANVFASLKQIYPDMQVDLFASRLNKNFHHMFLDILNQKHGLLMLFRSHGVISYSTYSLLSV